MWRYLYHDSNFILAVWRNLTSPRSFYTGSAGGGDMKNTVALAWDNRVVVSPHIGDLDAPRSLAVFEQVIADLQALYGVRAQSVVCDAHPVYVSSRWARRAGLTVSTVLHYYAHASAVDRHQRFVLMETALDGERMLDELEDDPLPRIC
ncbi:MAG: hypothetical protein ACYC9L_04190 [Sulfuricaulis sp.]